MRKVWWPTQKYRLRTTDLENRFEQNVVCLNERLDTHQFSTNVTKISRHIITMLEHIFEIAIRCFSVVKL